MDSLGALGADPRTAIRLLSPRRRHGSGAPPYLRASVASRSSLLRPPRLVPADLPHQLRRALRWQLRLLQPEVEMLQPADRHRRRRRAPPVVLGVVEARP